MKLPVFDSSGKEVGVAPGSDATWDTPMNATLLHQVVVALQAARRQGTHATKRRGEVAYSTRKLRQQKRSGRARLGSRGSPAMIGGGVAHGPHPRDYRQRLPKKMRRQALKVALSSKLRNQEVKVVDYQHGEQIKTRPLVDLVNVFGNGERSVMLVTEKYDFTLLKSSGNIANLSIMPADQLNALDVLKASVLLITRQGVSRIEDLWDADQTKQSAKVSK